MHEQTELKTKEEVTVLLHKLLITTDKLTDTARHVVYEHVLRGPAHRLTVSGYLSINSDLLHSVSSMLKLVLIVRSAESCKSVCWKN